ncbi:MAG: tRNA epoxyqueuosine(34) reductase QueG [Verrucomicrobiia bacterium]
MKELIRKKAVELGFDLCGFAPAKPATAEYFEIWLQKGFYGGMEWMKKGRQKRLNPALILPEAKSVIVVGSSYFARENERKTADEPFALLARYATFSDYHTVIGERLKLLSEFVVNTLACNAVYYVDTGAVLERDLAQTAGLGFIGKHTNLISKSFGNWLFIGEIITTAEIPPDLTEKNRCGRCSLCIKSCPTGAIVSPFQLDARLCISYLTIEHKGPIPVELRLLIGNHLFGCDDCLEVCPWNRFAKQGRLMNSNLLRLKRKIGLTEMLNLLSDIDEKMFKKMFDGTPVKRLGLQRFLRNSAIVLGNIGDERALKILKGLSMSPDPVISEHAAWAIDRITARKNITL